jgi:GTPase SAR1 family protein
MFIRGDEVAVVCFDTARRATFEHLTEWLNFFTGDGSLCTAVIVGNKTDLDPEVESEEISSYCHQRDISFFQTSAKTGNGIDELFKAIADIVEANESIVDQNPSTIDISQKEGESSCC